MKKLLLLLFLIPSVSFSDVVTDPFLLKKPLDINQFRTLYPAYNDLSDEAIFRLVQKKYYSNMGFEEFVQKVNPSSMIGKTQPVNIEGVGIVEFEDGMTPQQIEAAIVNDILPKFQSQQTSQTSSQKLPPCKFAKIGMACIKMPLSLPPCDMVLEGQNCLKMP